MKRRILLAFLFSIIFLANAYSSSDLKIVSEATPKKETSVMYIEDYDWGAGISKFVIQTKKEINAEELKAEDFEITIYTRVRSGNFSIPLPIKRKTPAASDVFLCDKYGNPIDDEKGVFVALIITATEEDKNTQPFQNTMLVDSDEIGNIKIENDELDIKIKNCVGIVNKKAALFEISTSKSNMKYASFIPEKSENKKIPLIVWFHAIGEGGTNPYMPLFGQRAVNLATDQIQRHFENGAAVLVPLCPTGYLELEKTDRGGNRLWAPVDMSDKRSTSYYTKTVEELIDNFIQNNPCIDTNRIYLGGASAGGYMVINMLLECPDKFAAAFTSSQAYPNRNIPDEDIIKLSKTPLWMIVCEKDKTISPGIHTLATYERLKKENAADIHLTKYETVSINGKTFDPHATWIYVFRDEIFDEDLNLFDWLSKCSLQNRLIVLRPLDCHLAKLRR